MQTLVVALGTELAVWGVINLILAVAMIVFYCSAITIFTTCDVFSTTCAKNVDSFAVRRKNVEKVEKGVEKMMIHNQAAKIASVLVGIKVIDEKSHDVYTYGFELIVSAAINILLMAVISILFHRYYDWLLFLVAFIPLRMTAGGFHAGSHLRCIMLGSIGFSVFLAVCHLKNDWTFVILATAAFSFVLILLFSPVEASNKKLSGEKRKKNRATSIYIGIANLLVAVALFFLKGFSDVLNIYFAGVFAAALSMLAVKAIKSRGGVECEDGKKLVPEDSV